jgi:hypothetical protein
MVGEALAIYTRGIVYWKIMALIQMENDNMTAVVRLLSSCIGLVQYYPQRTQSCNGCFLAYVHSVMGVKLALAGEGDVCTPTPFITFTITSKAAVYATAEWADTITLFHL